MNEEEAELLPPYLRPYPPSGAPLGTLSYNRRSKCWVVKGDPSVTEVCKRLFPGSAGSRRGEARFTAHRRAVGDLCWLMMRFPLEIKASAARCGKKRSRARANTRFVRRKWQRCPCA